MSLEIRLGDRRDIDAIENLYNDVNDYLELTINYPGWKKGIYPIREDAVEGVREQCLFVATHNNQIIGSMILRHKQESAYSNVTWQKDLKEEEVLVIYTFVVHPKFHNQEIGKSMLDFAYQYASKNDVKALRLDVYENNIPAINLYKKCNFYYIETVSLGLEQYGLNYFQLYERLI